MSEIQRYWTSCSDGWITMEPSDKGTWVRLDDHAAALRERDERIAALEMHRINATLAEKKDCERALVALAGAGICTPEETYGTNSSWAIADLCRAVAALRKQVERLSAPVTDADQITFCSYIDPFDHEKEVGNWDSKRIELMIAARKGVA